MINVLRGGIFSSHTGFYSSVRAARAFIFRCEPHGLHILGCAYPSSHTRLRQLGASRTGFYPSLNLRSTFAEGSEEARRKLGETSGGRGCIVCTFKCYKSAYYNIEVR